MLGLISRWRKARVEIRLKPMPDGFGFIYGDAIDAHGELRRINIMPPLPSWRGDIKLDKNGPHATDWVLYVDGDVVAREASYVDILRTVQEFLE